MASLRFAIQIIICVLLVACKGEAADIHNGNKVGKASKSQLPLEQLTSTPSAFSNLASSLTSKIASVASVCAAEQMRGKVYYYCDCGDGADPDCVSGNDANAGTSPAFPRQTIGNAIARYSSLSADETIAFCKGGAFNASGNYRIGSSRCKKGTTCNDLREYSPTTFAGIAKPTINYSSGGNPLFRIMGDSGGIRFLNLKLRGDGGTNGNHGFFFYDGAHDVTMCNLDMENFSIAVYNESGHRDSEAPTSNIKFTGNHVINSKGMGYLGGGMNDDISFNYWEGNGSSTVGEHTIYLASVKMLKNVRLIGNYVKGQYGPICNGAPFEAHMAVDGLKVKGNIIDISGTASTGGCWGIEFNNITDAPEPIYHRNAEFSGNVIRNGGNLALTVSGCPDCVIENNLIINETPIQSRGIRVASSPARPGSADDVNTRNIIRNNTIWYGPNDNGGGTGIEVGTEGKGHIIANNTISYTNPSTGGHGPFNCFKYPLPSGSYAFINNNHCFSVADYNWEASHGSLTAWKLASPMFDSLSFTGEPMFKKNGEDIIPSAGSPLAGKGSTEKGSKTDLIGAKRHNPPSIGAYE